MNKYLAEFLGSLFLMYIILVTSNPIAIGITLIISIILAQNISGGMFNPMVSVVMASAGKLARRDVVPFILAQIAGGLAALELTRMVKV